MITELFFEFPLESNYPINNKVVFSVSSSNDEEGNSSK
jgi:hypothetical protein